MDEKDKKEFVPWVERFRPRLLENIISHEEIVEIIKTSKFKHILFYGPPGTGKTSVIEAYITKVYGENVPFMVLNINASEERGIETVKDKINNFIISGSFISKSSKIVILDEVDSMTLDAQMKLRYVMERDGDVKFCLICNYIKKIIPALKSRCVLLKFSRLNLKNIKDKINEIAVELKIKNKIKVSGINMIYKISKGDMRKAINILQATYMAYGEINENTVAQCYGYPIYNDIIQINDWLEHLQIQESYQKLSDLIKDKGYSIANIISELTELKTDQYINGILSEEQYKKLIRNFHDIEINLTIIPSEQIQLTGLISSNK
jgi:replication factor C subunit 3/5